MASKITQEQRILTYIGENGSISSLEAMRDLGIMRLSARICEMRQNGHNIIGETEIMENRYGEKVHCTRYRLGKERV